MTDVARTIRRAAGPETATASKTLGRPQAVLYARYSSDKQNGMS